MTPDERERMNLLCTLIQHERDLKRYRELVTELNELVGRKDKRLEEEARRASQGTIK